MKALFATAPWTVECRDNAEPTGSNPSAVRVGFETGLVAAGTLRILRGKITDAVSKNFTYPIILGASGLGRVMDDSADGQFRAGDRVAINNVVTCGQCRFCLSGRDNLCANGQLSGIDLDGTFRDVVAVAGKRLIRVPDTLDHRLGVMGTEIAVLVRALRLGRAELGNVGRVAVVGAGSLGAHAVQLARHFDAETVYAADVDESRVEIARTLGASLAATPEVLADWIDEDPLTRAPNVTLVVTDHPDAISTAIRITAARGCVVCIGLPDGDRGILKAFYPNVIKKELTLRGCYAKSADDLARTFALISDSTYRVIEDFVEIPLSAEGAEFMSKEAVNWPDGKRYVIRNVSRP